jgi:hypothetical protein
MEPVLDRRTLGRALLERQLLLRRSGLTTEAALEHLVGLQAQVPQDPYVALWSRLAAFTPAGLSALLTERRAVRLTLMRGTVHLVTAGDCLALRPVMQPMIERRLLSSFGKQLAGLDTGPVAAAGRRILDEQPLTAGRLGELLREQWPDRDRLALALAVSARVPLVQPPPRGLWRRSGAAVHLPAESWLGRPFAEDSTPDSAVLRYLAAFGPASVKDIVVWSGFTGVRAVIDRLRPRLRPYRDENGTQLHDIDGLPLPSPDTSAPPRFLPQYDNLLLSHADRSRVFLTDEHRQRFLLSGREKRGGLLVDGFVHGTWRIEERNGSATLTVEPYVPLTARDRAAVVEEGERLLGFVAQESEKRDVRLT